MALRTDGLGVRVGPVRRARRSGGTGLGLAISIEDARLHQGRLEAWGEPGKGACFRLTLPLVRGHKVTSSSLPVKPIGEPAGVPTRRREPAGESV